MLSLKEKDYQEEGGDMYRLGREARERGYPKESCNMRTLSAKRSWWLAGWHDMDIEILSGMPHTEGE